MRRATSLPAVLAVALIASIGCSAKPTNAAGTESGGAAALPPDVFILPGASAMAMLHQCSRNSPAAGEGSFTPAAAEIATLEAGLAAALVSRSKVPPGGFLHNRLAGIDFSAAPRGWGRQYVGIVRGGKRYIYGNFFPSSHIDAHDEKDLARLRSVPSKICDGGPMFFGAEFDIERGQFTQIDFNGPG